MGKEPFKGNAFKYTEGELRDRGIGKRYDWTSSVEWKIKKATYTNEGVWTAFTALRDSFRALLRDEDGQMIPDKAQSLAQIMMDAFLVRRSRGERVFAPQQVVPVNAAPDSNSVSLISSEDFDLNKIVSENEKVRWIFENMQVEGVKPEDAPSPGAWALMQDLRGNAVARGDFYKTLWPKLLTKEDAEKGGKLADDGKETIQLIDRLLEALPAESE